MRRAVAKMHNKFAGWLTQDENGYRFGYDKTYLEPGNPEPVSRALPLQEKVFSSTVLFPFFVGFIPEGWLLDIAAKNRKLNPRDRMGLRSQHLR